MKRSESFVELMCPGGSHGKAECNMFIVYLLSGEIKVTLAIVLILDLLKTFQMTPVVNVDQPVLSDSVKDLAVLVSDLFRKQFLSLGGNLLVGLINCTLKVSINVRSLDPSPVVLHVSVPESLQVVEFEVSLRNGNHGDQSSRVV